MHSPSERVNVQEVRLQSVNHRFAPNVTTGSLSDGDFTVTLDSTALTPGVPTNFVNSTAHTLEIVAGGAGTFRGFLFRLAGGSTGLAPDEALAPLTGDTNAQYAITCLAELAGGVTHTNNGLKTSASANLTLPNVGSGLNLDVTVVVENRMGVSVFYYSGFVLNSITGSPTSPPVVAPVATPTKTSPSTPAIATPKGKAPKGPMKRGM